VRQNNSVCSFDSSDSWVILSPIEQSIKRKIEAVGTPLKDWDIQINYGIKTGYNEAFIISTDKRNEILADCSTEDERSRTEELIRPILRGRDIKRYSYEWANLYLIATFPSRHYDIEQYPSVKNYLLSFGIERLEQTGKTHIVNGEKIKARKLTNNKWFETQDSISYWEEFDKPKIMYQELSQGSSFALDEEGEYFVSNTGYLITGNDIEYIIHMLNSRVIEYCFKLFYSISLGDSGLRWLSQYIINLPLPQLTYSQKETLLTSFHNDTSISHNITASDNELSICKLFGFTKEEIAQIFIN
jgi:adenine-specific DNA-methyltransferase